jgi:eukaryotic-like serine/threonine-protein kinase
VTAADKKQVLRELGSAVQEIRGRLGEALSTMKKFNTPLDQATTSSLEALRAYTLGRKALERREDATAVSLFLRATKLDPNFALAYGYLGMSYMNLGETILGAENTRKAYDLRARVSEREKFYIESHYLHNVRGDLIKAREVYELWSQTYPDDLVPVSNLAGIYTAFGLYEGALAEDLRASRIEPTNASNYSDRVADYLYLNNVEAGEKLAEQALARSLDSPRLRIGLYLLAFLRNDKAGMAKQASWGAGKSGVEDKFLALDAETAAHGGRLAAARGLSLRAVTAAQNAAYNEAAATYEVSSALREALMGDAADARRHVIAALSISKGRDVEATAALTLSLIGEVAQSQKLVSDLDERFPEDTIVQFSYLPMVRGQIALDDHDPTKALAVMEADAMYELGDPGDLTIAPTVMCAIYVRGEAYLAANEGNKSAIEFTKILSHPGVVQNKLIGPLAYLGIARALKLQGDLAKARVAYEEFFALWQEADPDIPILIQAKREYSSVSQRH